MNLRLLMLTDPGLLLDKLNITFEDLVGVYMAKHKKSKTKRNGNGTKIRKGRKRKTILSRKASK